MKASSYRLDIARFVLRDLGDAMTLELDATLTATVPLDSLHLDLPGREPHLLSTNSAASDRIALSARLPAEDDPALDDASLILQAANGDRISFNLGAQLRRPGWWPRILDLAAADAPALHAPDALALADALATSFDDLDLEDLHLHPSQGVWQATSLRYGVTFDTVLPAAELDRTTAGAQSWPAIRARADLILAAVTEVGPLLLVIERTDRDTDQTMKTLFDTLRGRNPDAALLWLDRARAPGPVTRYGNGDDQADAGPPDLLLGSPAADRQATLAQARDILLTGA